MLIPTPALLRAAAFALCLLGLAPPVAAQDLVMADNPAKILEIARGFGSAELEADSEGRPRIRARMEGINYSVLFFGCEATVNCKSIQFWTYTAAPQNGESVVNAWNRDNRFGRAYIDRDGDVVVEMDVNLWGGVSQKNLDDTFDWWRTVLERVPVDFQEAAPETLQEVAPEILPEAQPEPAPLPFPKITLPGILSKLP
jgi:Putative bacterial sensory transduction regulator